MVTSALLLVALLVVLDLSYRRWMRRSTRRQERRTRADREIVLDVPEAPVIRIQSRRPSPYDERRPG